jgi:hypothetical protein
VRTEEINSQAKPEIKACFREPVDLWKDHMKQMEQVSSFQKLQAESFLKIVAKKVSQFNDYGLEGGGGKYNK